MPDYAEGHFNLALAHYELRQYSTAVVHFEKALQLEPDLLAARGNLALTLAHLGEVEQSRQQLARVKLLAEAQGQPNYADELSHEVDSVLAVPAGKKSAPASVAPKKTGKKLKKK